MNRKRTRRVGPRLRRASVCLFLWVCLSVLAPPLSANPAETVRDRWSFILQHLTNNKVDTAETLLEDLQDYQREQGIRNLFLQAELIDAMGMKAQAEGHASTALTYFRLASELAPDLPGPLFHLAFLQVAALGGEKPYLTALKTARAGFSALAENPEAALRHVADLIVLFFVVGLVTLAIFAVYLLFKYAPLATDYVNRVFGHRLHPAASLVLTLNVALFPFLVNGSVLLMCVLILAFAAMITDGAERRWAGALLLFSGSVPLVIWLLRALAVMPSAAPTELYRCERGLCGEETLARLEERSIDHVAWILKVRADTYSRSFRGDAFILETARAAYSTAMKLQEGNVPVQVNFANLLLAAHRYGASTGAEDLVGEAILLYDRALKSGGQDARVLYNKSRALAASSDSAGASTLLQRAVNADADLIYAKERDAGEGGAPKAGRPFNHNTDLFSIPTPAVSVFASLLREVRDPPPVANLLFGSLSTRGFLLSWGILVGLAFLMIFRRKGRPRAHYCQTCGEVISPSLTPEWAESEVCSVCFYQMIKGKYMEPKEALLSEIRHRRRERRLIAIAAFLNICVPGLGFLGRGRTGSGLRFIFASCFFLALILGIHTLDWIADPILWPSEGNRLFALLPWIGLGLTWFFAQVLQLRKPARRKGAIRGDQVTGAVPRPSRATITTTGFAPAPSDAPDFDAETQAVVDRFLEDE